MHPGRHAHESAAGGCRQSVCRFLHRQDQPERFDDVMDVAEREQKKLKNAEAAVHKAMQYRSVSDSAEFHRANGTLDSSSGQGKPVAKNLSPMHIDQNELWSMFQAAKRKMPYRIEVNKSFSDGGGIGFKTTGSPIAEGAPYPSGLFPPAIRPELTQDLRYEVDRMADHLQTVTIEAPSIEYLVHTGNTNPAAVVEELGVKPDLGVQIDTNIATPIKIAALASSSMEALQDFDYFSSWLPRELTKALVDVETEQIVSGTGANEMSGFVHTSGVLNRAYNPITDTSGLDTLIQACNDIRVGEAFGKADLIALHPSTWDTLKRTKTTTDAFVLSVMSPNEIGSLDNLFGVPVVTNTKIGLGSAVVMDTTLAAKYFVRQALTIDMNMWGDTQWTTNAILWRAEMRSTLAVTRPPAVCIVTGMHYDGS